jgi:hypothetical protein
MLTCPLLCLGVRPRTLGLSQGFRERSRHVSKTYQHCRVRYTDDLLRGLGLSLFVVLVVIIVGGNEMELPCYAGRSECSSTIELLQL